MKKDNKRESIFFLPDLSLFLERGNAQRGRSSQGKYFHMLMGETVLPQNF